MCSVDFEMLFALVPLRKFASLRTVISTFVLPYSVLVKEVIAN